MGKLHYALLTRIERVLNAEQRWSVTILHLALDLLLGNISTAILDADPNLQVVEVSTVQLEEFNQQHTQVGI